MCHKGYVTLVLLTTSQSHCTDIGELLAEFTINN